MRKKILTVTMVLGAICILGNGSLKKTEENSIITKAKQTKCFFIEQSLLKAGITPPIKPIFPKKMYEEPVSSVTESYQFT